MPDFSLSYARVEEGGGVKIFKPMSNIRSKYGEKAWLTDEGEW